RIEDEGPVLTEDEDLSQPAVSAGAVPYLLLPTDVTLRVPAISPRWWISAFLLSPHQLRCVFPTVEPRVPAAVLPKLSVSLPLSCLSSRCSGTLLHKKPEERQH